ncbi:hypothetical protein RGQ29_004420 [Quercus rubra]|uniref:Cytochrome P450 n=1 Tax=Quercus rubra TaxID=3512 RepID=A0AAN7EFZ2_QUERU|nr:hypothetical protein RGQ29_004420 [Quercus rubra]
MFLSLLVFIPLGFLFLSSLLSITLQVHCHYSKSSTPYGPPSYPILGCLLSFYKNQNRILDWYTDLLSISPTKTISVKRLGARRTIVTANPDNVEYILKTHFRNFPKGKPFTELLGDLLGFGIFNADGELWSTQRKLASHEFSTKSLRDFVVKTLEDEVRDRLIPILESAADSNKVLDLQDVLRRLAFDSICRVALGIDPCALDLSSPLPVLAKAIETASEISAKRATQPLYLVWKIKRALNLGSEKKLKESIATVHGLVSEIIQTKRQTACENRDLLSRLVLAGHDEQVIRDMVISFIIAGRDTTSSALTWLLWLLTKHRNKEELIVKEVNHVLENQKALDFEALKELRFIHACLCESMRLYPPVAWDSKHAATDDILPDGTKVRKGDRVTYFPYGMGKMEELWGKDRFEFKPDRWFDEPGGADIGGELKYVSPYKYPVFQAGPRVCIGKEMAFIQMKYVVADILRRFEIKPVFEVDEPVYIPLFTAEMAGGFKVTIKKRSGCYDSMTSA